MSDDTVEVYAFNRETNEAYSSDTITVYTKALEEGAIRACVVGFRTVIDLHKYRLVLEEDMGKTEWDSIKRKQYEKTKWRIEWEDRGRRNDYRRKTLTQEEKANLPHQMKASEFVGMETEQAKTLLLKQHPYSRVEVTKPGVGICEINFVQIIEKNGKVQTVNIN
jgi:hypothetical protein